MDIKTIIAEQLGIDRSEVTDDADLFALGADDLDVIEIAIEAETRFNIEIDDEAVENAQTVGDLVKLVEGVH